jgi:hypothetical protein
MENLPLPPAIERKPASFLESRNNSQVIGWEVVEPKASSTIPCQRSLHAAAVWKDQFLVFGGYDGLHRVNDLYAFDFKTSVWRVLNNTDAPSPRDRHVAVVYSNSLYIFGGFDGVARVNGSRFLVVFLFFCSFFLIFYFAFLFLFSFCFVQIFMLMIWRIIVGRWWWPRPALFPLLVILIRRWFSRIPCLSSEVSEGNSIRLCSSLYYTPVPRL